jgi:erythromycin esterase
MRRRLLATGVLVALLLAPAAAQNGNTTWVSWARANHYGLAAVQSPDGDTFPDLGFLRGIIGSRRLVQLGESGHGVAEFNHAKVRLIKYLHEQMGFDVIAFESAVYECYGADARAAVAPASSTMRDCIFQVWHTDEVVPLFEYIKSTHATSRPLRLAGFDTQISSRTGSASRPAFFANLVRRIDPGRAAEVESTDQEIINGIFTATGGQFAKANEARTIEFYSSLERLFRDHRAALSNAFGDVAPRVAERAAWSMLRYLEQLRASVDRPNDATLTGGGGIRDAGMAENVSFLADDLFAGRKIILWAHNFHIRHDNASTTSRQPTMGQWVRERFRDQLYTVGLYMDRGTAAQNDRRVYPISPAPVNSMEWILANTGSPALFIDFLHQQRTNDTSWMFQSTVQRDWGVNAFSMIPRNQYDGILFINEVQAPSYVRFTN